MSFRITSKISGQITNVKNTARKISSKRDVIRIAYMIKEKVDVLK